MLYHYTYRGFAADNYSILSFPDLGKIFKYGYLGVQLFVIISGYVMFLSAPHKSFKDFVISRVLRLYLTFWIAVILTSIITLLIGAERFHVTPLQFLANLTMLNEYLGIPSIDATWWFMTLVLKFNLFIGILSLLKLIKFQDYFAGIWLVLGTILKFINVPILSNLLMPDYVSFFVAGIIFQSAKARGWNKYKYFTILFSLLLSIYISASSINSSQQHFHQSFSVQIIIIVLFYLAFYLITIQKQSLNLPKVLLLYGTATYPLYLIHQNIGYMIFNSLGNIWNKYLLLFGTVVVMILISIVIAKYLEPYLYKILRRTLEAFLSFIENFFRKKLAG
jgi:peptidoglycan/LPS O-acetylase OafA/YrhL